MNRFCILKFCDNYEYLQSKFSILKNKKIRDIYVKKFNPFKIEDFCFGGLEEYLGYNVILPITKADAHLDNDLLEYLVEKTVKYLKSLNVNIILYDEVFFKSDEIFSLENLDINIFFLQDILKRVIKSNCLSRKDVSVSIISGEFNETNLILNEIYNDINFLSLVEKDGHFSMYESITDMIFCDCGLEISFSNSLREADIIINLCEEPKKFLKSLKKNAVIIDLKNSILKDDVKNSVIKNTILKVKDEYLKDFELELILYAHNINYRRFKDNTYNLGKFLYLKNEFNNMLIKFNNFKSF